MVTKILDCIRETLVAVVPIVIVFSSILTTIAFAVLVIVSLIKLTSLM